MRSLTFFADYSPMRLSCQWLPLVALQLNWRVDCPHIDKDLVDDFDYVAVFHRHLRISVLENRFSRPEDQPIESAQRLFQPPKTET